MNRVFSEATVDDLLHAVYLYLIKNGHVIRPSKGAALEETGVLLELSDPQSRVSRSAKRSKIVSFVGELSWYLSGSDLEDHIAKYVPKYRDYAVDGRLLGAYGPRLFRGSGGGQIHRVIAQLGAKVDTRQAVVQLFDAQDVLNNLQDVPCTCTLQFLLRGGRLSLVVVMRSNDAYLGLPHDLFAFTMIQELVARSLGVELGTYSHFVGSLHLYNKDRSDAEQYLDEGWYDGRSAQMPAMPPGDPWARVAAFLEAERRIRLSPPPLLAKPASGSEYWDDLLMLLLAHRLRNNEVRLAAPTIEISVANEFFRLYLSDRSRKQPSQ